MNNTGQTLSLAGRALSGVPGIYLLLLCDVIREMGLDDVQLLDGLEVDRGALLRPDTRVSVMVCGIALERALTLASGRGLGFAYARAMRLTLHGSLGMLALSSPSGRDALQAAVRYLGIRAPFLGIRLSEQDEVAIIELLMNRVPENLLAFFNEALLLGLAYMQQQLYGWSSEQVELWLTGDEPAYAAVLAPQLPVRLCYGKPSCQLRLPLSLLEARPVLADPMTAELARLQCEQEFSVIFEDRNSIRARVAALLETEADVLPTLEDMASRFFMSSRTLKRRLQEEGVTYRDLTENESRRRAERLLADSRISISEVAYQLGYQDVSNFSRAFRRWTGMTPKAFRESPITHK